MVALTPMGGVSGGMKALIGRSEIAWIIAKRLNGVWMVLVQLLSYAMRQRVNASMEYG